MTIIFENYENIMQVVNANASEDSGGSNPGIYMRAKIFTGGPQRRGRYHFHR